MHTGRPQLRLIFTLVLVRRMACYLPAIPRGTSNVSKLIGDLACPACGSPALSYPGVLKDDEPVRCVACGEIVCTYGELKHHADRASKSGLTHSLLSGC
jgi:hypothetical protein